MKHLRSGEDWLNYLDILIGKPTYFPTISVEVLRVIRKIQSEAYDLGHREGKAELKSELIKLLIDQ